MFDLTEKEKLALFFLTRSCLSNMGGTRPLDLDNDPFTWIDVNDLVMEGFTLAQSRGLFSSLMEKGVIADWSEDEPTLTEQGYQFAETIWDDFNTSLSQKKYMIQ